MTPGNNPYFYSVIAVDKFGNESDIATSYEILLDNEKPVAPTLLSPTNNSYLSTHNFKFEWNPVADFSLVTYEWESSFTNTLNLDGSFASRLAYHANLGTFVNSPGTPDNKYYWHVRATDSAGNVGDWSEIWNITVDTLAPDVKLTSPTSSLLAGTVSIRGTVEDLNPDHYWFVIQNSSNVTVAGPGTVYEYNSFTDNLLLNWNTKNVPDGSYKITLSARDAAENKDSGSTDIKTVRALIIQPQINQQLLNQVMNRILRQRQ